MNKPEIKQRTDWAEQFVEALLAQPLISEFVYRSPQTMDKTQKEVGDFLLVLRDQGVLISQKCQQDPIKRSGTVLAAWTSKKASSAIGQLKGALRLPKGKPVWCEQPRRGRVDFPFGIPPIVHAIVAIEVSESADLPSSLPLHLSDLPVSYISVNDLCNLVGELRTFPDILGYLNARVALPAASRLRIGSEKALYEYYLLNDSCFESCEGHEDACVVAAARHAELVAALSAKKHADFYTHIIEDVAHNLSQRLGNYADGLSEEIRKLFDEPGARKNYLLLQTELCDLALRDRGELGRQFLKAMEQTKNSQDSARMSYAAAYFDSKPDFVYALASTAGIPRPEVIKRAAVLLQGAMAFYEKTRGMVIVDRDGEGYEVALSRPGVQFTEGDRILGERLFGKLKMRHAMSTLVPTDSSP